MARDAGLEEAVRELLVDVDGVSEKRMFGGLAWLLDGRLLCAARTDGTLVRLGKGRDGWALAVDGVTQMVTRGRPMTGWIWARPEAFADERFAEALIEGALRFVRTLPANWTA